jgi:hypothetical protein
MKQAREFLNRRTCLVGTAALYFLGAKLGLSLALQRQRLAGVAGYRHSHSSGFMVRLPRCPES